MAVIPEYKGGLIPSLVQGPTANLPLANVPVRMPEVPDISSAELALAETGKAIMQAGGILGEIAKKKKEADETELVITASNSAIKDMTDAALAAKNYEEFLQQSQKIYQASLAQMPSHDSRKFLAYNLGRHVSQIGTNLQYSLFRKDIANKQAIVLESLALHSQEINDLFNRKLYPTPESMEEGLRNIIARGISQIDAMAQAGVFDADNAYKLKEKFAETAWTSYVHRSMLENPMQVHRDLIDGKYNNVLPAQTINALLERTEAKIYSDISKEETYQNRVERELTKQDQEVYNTIVAEVIKLVSEGKNPSHVIDRINGLPIRLEWKNRLISMVQGKMDHDLNEAETTLYRAMSNYYTTVEMLMAQGAKIPGFKANLEQEYRARMKYVRAKYLEGHDINILIDIQLEDLKRQSRGALGEKAYPVPDAYTGDPNNPHQLKMFLNAISDLVGKSLPPDKYELYKIQVENRLMFLNENPSRIRESKETTQPLPPPIPIPKAGNEGKYYFKIGK